MRCGEGEAAKSAPAHGLSNGQTFPWAEDSAFDLSLPLSVIVQCLDDRILHSPCGRPRLEILADTLLGYAKLFLLIGLFLRHDGPDHCLRQLSLPAEGLHLNGLRQRWGAVCVAHRIIEDALFLFGKVRQLHGGPEGDFAVVHHRQNLRKQVGETDVST